MVEFSLFIEMRGSLFDVEVLSFMQGYRGRIILSYLYKVCIHPC